MSTIGQVAVLTQHLLIGVPEARQMEEVNAEKIVVCDLRSSHSLAC